jgi:hypothetical protein
VTTIGIASRPLSEADHRAQRARLAREFDRLCAYHGLRSYIALCPKSARSRPSAS